MESFLNRSGVEDLDDVDGNVGAEGLGWEWRGGRGRVRFLVGRLEVKVDVDVAEGEAEEPDEDVEGPDESHWRRGLMWRGAVSHNQSMSMNVGDVE